LLVGHFEEEQISELLHIIAIRKAIVAQDVAIVPEFLDELLGVGHMKIYTMKL